MAWLTRDTENHSEEIEHGTGVQTDAKHGHGDGPKIGRNSQPPCPPVQTGNGTSEPHCPPVQTGLELDKKTGNGQKWRRGRQENYHGGCL